MSEKNKEILLSSDVFSRLGKEQKSAAFELVEEIEIKKGEEIALYENLGCLVKGKARVLVKNSGGTVMKKLGIGEVFGCAALYGGDFVTEIKADSDCRLCCISRGNMTELFMKNPAVAVDYIKYLSTKIRYLNSRIGDFAPAPAEQRVLGFLKKQAEKQNPIKIPMTLLANELGIGRTSLYRVLDALENNNHIKRLKNEITVL